MNGTDDDFIRWVIERLRETGRTRSALAAALGVHPSQVTAILKGRRKRGVTSAERAAIMAFFDASNEVASAITATSTLLGGLAVAGVIADHIWTDISVDSADNMRLGTPILTYPLEDQRAFRLGVSSKDGEWRANDFLYVVPFASYRSKLLLDDAVVVRRRQGDLVSYGLMIARRHGKGLRLEPAFAGAAPPGDTPDIVGLVIGVFRPRERTTT